VEESVSGQHEAGQGMTTYDALHRAILSCPQDDAPRLMLADWLAENGQEERAEFVRVQIELARWPDTVGHHEQRTGTWQYLRARERQLLSLNVAHKWFVIAGVATYANEVGGPFNGWLRKESGQPGYELPVSVRRGFITELTCSWASWLEHAEAVYWWPGATEVECPDCHGIGFICQSRGPQLPCDSCMVEGRQRAIEGGTGRIPRPVPPGAQPIERVTFSAGFDDVRLHPRNHTVSLSGIKLTRHADDAATGLNSWRCDRWPWVEFVLPEAAQNTDQTDALAYAQFAQRMAAEVARRHGLPPRLIETAAAPHEGW